MPNISMGFQLFQDPSGTVLAIHELRRDVDMPGRVRSHQGIDPLSDPGFAGVDLLAPADKTHDNSPIRVPIQTGNQEFGLGVPEPGPLFLPFHKIRGLGKVPGALGFIKKGHMIDRRLLIDQAFVAEMMHVLDEGFDAALGRALCGLLPAALLPRDHVSRQGLLEYLHEGPVPREKNAMV